ncbi:MAG TPA: phospho-sugar mutase, partial [Pirellulales bacterium]|nr:phospho-sugar mutase [Pirellulales bacterium]
MTPTATGDVDPLLAGLARAVAGGKLTSTAEANIRRWLLDPQYARERPTLVEHITGEQWQALDDVFWTVIPFGTGGRRGRMYPIGTNAINDRTVGESAQGLADYVKKTLGRPLDAAGRLRCAIAYDTRHRSRHFAELCAEIMLAAGFTVEFR